MATERPPRKAQSKVTTIRRGGKTWHIDHDEIREREGTVDASGMRTIRLFKDPANPAHTAAQANNYRKLGYDVDDTGYECVMTIKDSVYRAREAAQHEAAIRKTMPRKTGKPIGGNADDFEEEVTLLEAQSPASVMELLDNENDA